MGAVYIWAFRDNVMFELMALVNYNRSISD